MEMGQECHAASPHRFKKVKWNKRKKDMKKRNWIRMDWMIAGNMGSFSKQGRPHFRLSFLMEITTFSTLPSKSKFNFFFNLYTYKKEREVEEEGERGAI